jgi:hypothetical protein
MAKNKKFRDPIPEHFKSIAEAGEFWDTHSLADYWDQTREVRVKFDLKSSVYMVALEPGLFKRLGEHARRNGVSSETLINVWLTERLTAAAQSKTRKAA